MRVSNEYWLKGPEPVDTKLLVTPPAVGVGNSASTLPIFGSLALITLIGIMLFAKAVRPVPSSGLPVAGSNIWPAGAPFTVPKAFRYWLKSQNPGVALAALVAGLQVLS